MKEVSIFEGFVKVVKQVPMEKMLDSIKCLAYAKQINELRELVAAGDQKGSDALKRRLPAFTPLGTFRYGRSLPCLVTYSGYHVLDIDSLTADELKRVKTVILLCKYTMACFVSPSGNGLKVLVSVSTGVEDHLNTFLCVHRFYSTLTGVKIDPSGKDVTRLCFVSADADLYFNPESTVFDPFSGAGQSWPAAISKGPAGKSAAPVLKPITADDVNVIYQRAIASVERFHTFTLGQRNTFNFNLSIRMRGYGISEMTTLKLLLRDYNYSDSEVRSSVQNAYSYNLTIKPRGGKEKMQLPIAGASKAEAPPPVQKSKKGGDLYVLKETEALLLSWYETRHNVITGVVEFREAGSAEPFVWLEDKHEHSMFCKLHHEGQLIPMSTLHIILHSDFSPDFDAFVDYFDHLDPWDGTTDYIGQLSDTVKTKDDRYWKITFLKWFVAFVASMIREEIINHTVLVLVGSQGVGKTTWMKRLMPFTLQAFLGTTAMQIDSKDAAIQIAECGLIILDEMESLNRKDLAAFKELITRPKSRIRRPYGRNTENIPHRASFGAGVNHKQILTDLSGTRRYLCSDIISIDSLHEVDIDGCMAQAYALFLSGLRYWFDQEEIKELTRHNEDFESKTVEEELISTWFVSVTREEWDNRLKFANSQSYLLMTATDVATKIMEKARFNLVDSTIVKIGRILTNMKFKRIRKGNNNYYMVRLIDTDTVEKTSHNLELTPQQIAEQENNEQIIRFEEDLFTSSGDDGLPF